MTNILFALSLACRCLQQSQCTNNKVPCERSAVISTMLCRHICESLQMFLPTAMYEHLN